MSSKMVKMGVLAVASIVAFSVLAAEVQGFGMGMNHDRPWMRDGGYMNANENSSAMDQLYERGYMHGLMGRMASNGHGHFVSFQLDSSNGVITDYSIRNRTEFQSIASQIEIVGFAPDSIASHGSVLIIGNETVHMVIHDNPTGMIRMFVNNTTTTTSYLFAEGINVTKVSNLTEGDAANVAVLTGDGKLGFLAATNGTMTVEKGASGTYLNVTLENGTSMLRFRPLFAHSLALEQAMMSGIFQNRVGGEISVVARGDKAIFDLMQYDGSLDIELNRTGHHFLEFVVSSPSQEGKVILINVDSDTLSVTDTLDVKMDGREVRYSSNPLEVLYASGSSSSDAVYTVVNDGEHSQLMLYVPHFSTHTLSVQSTSLMDEITGPMGIVAIVAAIAVVTVAAVILIRRR